MFILGTPVHTGANNWKSKFFGEFEYTVETALDHESGDQLGTFGKITLGKNSHATAL